MLHAPGYIGGMPYLERLRVPAWWWLVAIVMVGSLAMAILAYVPLAQGLVVVGLFTLAVGAVIFSYGHTGIRVSEGALHVGRNRIECHWIAGAEALDRRESTAAMSSNANHRDFLMTRPYIGELVRVRIDDVADPHPHWLVSSRRAGELAEAVEAISGR